MEITAHTHTWALINVGPGQGTGTGTGPEWGRVRERGHANGHMSILEKEKTTQLPKTAAATTT